MTKLIQTSNCKLNIINTTGRRLVKRSGSIYFKSTLGFHGLLLFEEPFPKRKEKYFNVPTYFSHGSNILRTVLDSLVRDIIGNSGNIIINLKKTNPE